VADYLFVYGTLKPELAPPEVAALVRQFRRIDRGTISGFLYDLGNYPGLRLDVNGNEVQGEVFELHDPAILLMLDAYEGYDPKRPTQSLFLRKQCQVRLQGTDERLLCWVYEYNHEPAASLRIAAWPSKS
jgi:gamma-glutamylcyclotransferase (GGCT)/AIG2-like uncharacterized protein YtfP